MLVTLDVRLYLIFPYPMKKDLCNNTHILTYRQANSVLFLSLSATKTLEPVFCI